MHTVERAREDKVVVGGERRGAGKAQGAGRRRRGFGGRRRDGCRSGGREGAVVDQRAGF